VTISTRGIVAGAALTALTAGTFALGMHLGPEHSLGHNLASIQTAQGDGGHAGSLHLASYQTSAAKTKATDADTDTDDAEAGSDPGATFQEVYLKLKRNYVEGVPDDTILAHGAAAAMVASLGDPQSRFLEPAQMQELKDEIQGTYHGIGATTFIRSLQHGDPKATKDTDIPGYIEYRLTVVAPLPGSPAEKAGLLPGDVITEINGKWIATYDPITAATKDLKAVQNDPVSFNKLAKEIQAKVDSAVSLSEAMKQLTGDTSDKFVLTVSRPGQDKPQTLTLDNTAPTKVTPIASRTLPGNIGYVKITQFTESAPEAFGTALSTFGADTKGLILDLRNSPGGLLDSGAAIASKLTTAKSLGIVQLKGKKESAIAIKPSKTIGYPIVVLVNRGTANTAELLADTLHRSGAKLVGEKTFGDATDVSPVALRDGSGFTMTVGQLFTSAHGVFNEIGVKPDIVTPPNASPEEPLTQAIGLLSGQVAGLPAIHG
jgi:carboxyl-terminal processing protease